MKKNKNIKILLPLVIIIWGILLYNIYDAFYPDTPALSKNKAIKYKAPKVEEKESFSLLPIKSDPFLGTLYKESKKKSSNSKSYKNNKTKNWPTISYSGIVSDKNARSNVFIVSINGQQYLLKKGDTLQKVKVINGTKENIHLRFQGQTKEFPIM